MKLISGKELTQHLSRLGNDWHCADEKRLCKEFKFTNFKEALEFTNKIGAVAESQGHHPDIELGWGRVKLSLTTHDHQCLTLKDFRLAEAINQATISYQNL